VAAKAGELVGDRELARGMARTAPSPPFFRDQEFAMLKALGIVVVEGDWPGSTYYAAELRGSIDDANATAATLEVPFRFRRATR
jgi:hypothetical protein